MATQNSTITVKGKLGNIVGYKGRKGQKLARIRQTEVHNPKTIGQVLQRMILSTASKAYGQMKGITDHSFQGVSYGADSQSYFLKRAMEDIRNFVAQAYPDFTDEMRQNPAAFIGLAEPKYNLLAGVGLLISEGTIPTIPAVYGKLVGAEEPSCLGFGKQLGAASVSAAKVGEVMDALGAKAGDQLTTTALIIPGNMFNGVNFEYTRLVFNAEMTDADRDKLWGDEIENMRSGAGSTVFDADRSLTGELWPMPQKKTANMYTGVIHDQGFEIAAAALILSHKMGSVWQRSTQRLAWQSDAGDFVSPDIVVPTWQEGTTAIDAPSPYYLNNAEQAGE